MLALVAFLFVGALGVFVLVGFVVAVSRGAQTRRVDDDFRRFALPKPETVPETPAEVAARRLGFERRVDSIEGQLDGHRVDVQLSDLSSLYVVGGVTRDFNLGDEGLGVAKRVGGEDHQIGHPDFDALVRVRGSRDWALALMGSDAAARFMALQREGALALEGGELRLRAGAAYDAQLAEARVRQLVDLAGLLPERDAALPLLLHLVGSESAPLVRRAAALRLLAPSADVPRVRDAIDAAARGLEATVKDETVDSQSRAELFSAMAGARAPFVSRIALALLQRGPGSPRRVAIRIAGESGEAAVVPELLAFCRRAARDEWPDLCVALSATRSVEAEDWVLEVLATAAGDARIAAASALGALGTVRAVEALHPLASGSLLAGPLSRAAAESIRRIQSRLAGADHGQLTVADAGDAGALSEPSGPRAAPKKQPT